MTHMILTEFEEGTQVWLKGCHLKMHHPMTKLAPHRYRPFTITAKLSLVMYHLNLPPCMTIHNVFHMDLLTQYCETKAHGPNYERPAPDVIEGESEWEVETPWLTTGTSVPDQMEGLPLIRKLLGSSPRCPCP